MNDPLSTPAARANLLYTIEDASPPSGFPRRADLAGSSRIRRLTQTFKIVLRRKGVRTMNAKSNSIPRLLSLLVILSVIIPAILSGPVQVALAAQVSFSPTAYASVTGYTTLTNPQNAYGDDTSYATGGGGTTWSLGQQYYGFNASIPSGTLSGIEVRVDYWITNNNGTNTLTVDLSTDGTNWTTVTDADNSEPLSQATVYLGTPTELWGRTWTAADLSNLRVRVRMARSGAFQAGTFYLDYVAVRLTYNTPPNAPTNTAPAAGASVATRYPTFTWSAFSDPDTGDAQNQFHIQLRQSSGNYTTPYREYTSGTSTASTYPATTWNLPDGDYCWHVQVRDNSGASNAYSDYSTETCFTVDATAPTSSATSPAYANASPFTVSVNNASDAGSGVSYVQLYARISTGAWALVSQISAPGPYQWSYTPGANGTYYFQSRACDAAGNCETQPTGNFGFGDSTTIYDNVPPTSAATPPAGPINIGSIAVPWTASDATSGIATNGVTLYYNYNGGSYSAFGTDSGTGGTFNFTPANGDGTYCFYTRATDNAGNVEAAPTTNDGCTVYKTLGSIGDRVWRDANGNGVQDAGETGINGVTLTLYQGATVVGTTTTAGDGNYLFSNLTGAALHTVRDTFSTQAYNNNDGTDNWAGSWTESDTGGGGATGGYVLVTGNRLSLTNSGSSVNSMYRQANLAGNTSAVLSFDFATSGASVDPTDAVVLEVSADGGATWTQLEQFLGNYGPSYSGSRTYDISDYMAANTRIRFTLPNGSYTSSNEIFYVDNVQIQYQNAAAGTYTVSVDASNFNAGGALNGLQPTDGLAAVSPLTVNLGAGEDINSADFGYGPFALIGGVLYEDTNRNGIHDAGETTVLPNITVWLYTDANGNGKIDGADAIIRTYTTDASGRYFAGGLSSGSYLALADVTDPDLPGGFRPTSPNPASILNVVTGSAYLNNDIGFNTPTPVTKNLYLRTPRDLTRNAPTGLTPTTVQILSSDVIRSHAITWTMPLAQALAGPITFVNGQVVQAVLRIQSNPSASALQCGGQLPDVTLTLSVVGGSTLATAFVNDMPAGLNTRTIDLNIPAGTTIPAGSRLQLKIDASGADCGLNPPQDEDADGYIVVYFDSVGENSHLQMPVVSYIDFVQANTYDAAYPGGAATSTFIQGDTVYLRATAADPFGYFDISGITVTVPGALNNVAMTRVATTTLTSTYERSLAGLLGGNYTYTMTATEGSEGEVTAVITGTFNVIVSNLGNSSKTVDKAAAAPGSVLTYTILLSNTGGLNATVRMTDTLPANVTYLSGPTGGGSYNAGLNAILFNGTVPANGQVILTYRVTIDTPLDNGTIIANNATINDSYTRFDTSPPATTVIQSAPNLSTSTKSVDKTTAAPGDSLVYTVILTNTGNMNAYIGAGTPFIDNIPANTAFDGGLFASAGTISYNPGFNRIEWVGAVPASGSVTLRFRVKIATPLDNTTVITNIATINEGTGFPNPQTYQRTATTTIQSAPNLTAQSAKLVDKALAAPGDTLAYTIILKNSGNMNAPNVTLTDTLPANVSWAGDAFLSATSGAITYTAATRTVTWNGDMNAGASVQIIFRAVANTPLPNNTQIVNTARVSDAAGNFAPFNLSAITTIQSSTNLNTSTKVVSAATASPGSTLTYTITVINTGNAVASGSLTDTLPAELQNPVLVSVSSGTAQVVGAQVIWSGPVTPTQNVVVVFRATLLPVLNNGIQVANTALVNDGVNPAFYISPAAVTTIQSTPNLNTSLKRVDRATAAPGDLLVYTIYLTNTGNMAASTLVQDALPTNVTFNGGLIASPGAPQPTYSSINNRVSWQGDVVPGTVITVSYQVRVNTPLDNGTVILNDAQISDGVHTPFDTAPAAQTTIAAAPDLTTSNKSVDLTTAAPGDLLHYTVRLVNTGNMVAAGAILTDIIPTNVTFASGPFVSGGGSGGWNPGQRRVFWNGSVTPGSDVTVEYYATVNTPLANGTVITNDATIGGSFATVTTNLVTTTIQSDHQLVIDKTGPSAIGAGQRITYTLQYNVTGNEPAPSVVITDAVPANTTYVSCTGGCTQTGGVVTWNLGNLVPGNTGTVQVVMQVVTPLTDGTIINNTASIRDAENAPVTDSVATTVTSGHGFSLSKSDTGYDPVQAGGTLVYTLNWSVGGTAVAQSVVITDALPANTTYASCSGATCSQSGGIVTWNLNNQNPGASGTVTVTVTVASPLPNGTVLTNNARIYDANGGLPTTASAQTTVQSSHTLNLTKTGQSAVSAGGQITYTINWSVSGNEASQNLTIEDSTPVNTTFASASGATTIEAPNAGASGLVRWRLGTQNPGASGSVTLVVNVNSPLPNGTIVNNTASIYDSNGGATHEATYATTVNSSHTFILTKTDTPDPVSPNGLINYTIHWQVTGNETALGVVITDGLPLNTTYNTCGACVLMGDYVRWDIGDRAPGSSGDIFLQVRVNTPLVNGTLINNSARISDNNNGAPVTASAVTTVASDHQLALTKSAPSIVAAGAQLTYTLGYNVTGNAPAPTVVLTDVVPANTTFVSCTGGCTQVGSLLTWNLGNLVPGNSGSVSFVVTVSNLLPNGTVINNTARVYDAASRSASATASTTVSSGHGYSLGKRDTGYDPVQAGGVVIYSIDWSLAGTEAATSVVITDAIPANSAYASCGGATCSQAGGIVTWNLGNRNPGASGTVTVAVTAASPLPNGTILTDNARISDSNGGTPTTASEQTTVNSSHALHVAKTGPANVAAGGQITYTISWSVSGNEASQSLVIEDTTPPNTTYARASGAGTIDNPGVGNSGLVRWHLNNQNPGASGTVVLVVNVASPLANGTAINNTANILDSNNGATASSSASTQVNSSHTFTLSKTDTPDPVTPDGLINYNIHWTVTGNETGQSVIITDAIPLNTSYQTCGACVLMGDYVRWDLGDRAPGSSGDVFLQVHVNTAIVSGTVIVNNARISDSSNGAAVAATASTTVNSGHQLTLSKSAPSTIQAGQVLNYSIAWAVTGNEPAPTVVITDAVPANTTYASCGGATCSIAGGVVTWNLGNLVPGNSGTATLAVTVGSPLANGTVITNTARIYDASNRNAVSSAYTTVTSAHGYTLSKSDAPDPVQAGGALVYTLNWSLSGSEAATGVVITDALPAATTFVNCSNACTQAGGIVTWNLGNQNIGASGSVTVAVNVVSPQPNGTILTNNARISDGNGGAPATASAQTTVNSSHTLAITKTGPATVAAGGQIAYTLRYTVTGNETATGVTIDDNTPLNTTFASASGTGTIQAPPVGSTGLVRWQIGSVPPGTSGTATLVVNVTSPLASGTIIANSASLADTNGGTTVSASWNTTVSSGHTLTLSKSDTPDPVSPNGIINYTINWSVSGSEVAQNVVITDAVPANTTLVSPGTCSAAGSLVTCNLGNQSPGALGAVSLQVRVTTPLANNTVINNAARISDSNGGNPVVATAATTVNSDHQFTLSKGAASAVQAGQLLTYTINWSVTGDEPTSNVTITDAVPVNTTYVSCTSGCTQAGGVVTWNLGARVPGNSGTVQFTVQVVSPLPNGTIINNTARIFDATRNATATAATTVGSGHGYTLSKTDAPDPVAAGGALVYTLNWSLSGNEAATGVVITDALPANVTFASCTNGCTQAGGIVTWNLGAQSIGASGSVAVTVNVATPLPNGTVLTNNARISDSNGGIATTASAQTTVQSSHALVITKTGPTTVAAGGQIAYTLRYTVTGNETAQNVTIDDNTPANTTFASATGTGIQAPPVGSTGLVRWQLGNLTPGASGMATLVVNVNSPLASGTIIANSASIADTNGGTTVSSSWNTTVNSSHSFTLTKTDTPDPVAPNGIIYYTINWSVSGSEVAQSVVITDAVPANTTLVSPGTCSQVGSIVQCTLGNQNPGALGAVSLQVRVTTPLANNTVINNAARISDSNNGAPVVATAATTVSSDHQFTLSKGAASAVQAGQLLTYTINWSVTGDEPTSNVTITDAVPVNTTYVSCTSGCTQAGGVVTWNLGARVPGNSGTVQFTVQVVSPLPNGTIIVNTARIYDTTRNATATASTTVGSGHGYSLNKSDAPDPVAAGSALVYTLNWSLSGNEAATGVVITDALPANVTFASCTNGCTQAGGIVTWNLGAQNIGASGSVAVTVNVATPLPNGTVLTNNARISDSNGGIATTASAQTTVQSSHALAITKTGPTTVAAGGQIAYTLRYTVTGNETAQSVTIDDNTPVNTTFASATGGGTIQAPPVGNTGLVRWQLGNLTPGTSGTVTLVVNVNSPLLNGTAINNTATIADSNNGATGSSSASTQVSSTHGFTLSKVDTPDPVTPNGVLNYTVHWAVTGNEAAQSLVITDAIPANTTFWSCGSCGFFGNYVSWDLDDRDPGVSGDVFLQVRVNTPMVNGTVITNTARISDGNGGTPVGATATTTVASDHNLTIKKNAPAAVGAGNVIAYSIDYSVSGSELALGVAITDEIPANTTYEAGTCQPSASCAIAGNLITWTLGDLQPGDQGTVQFVARTDSLLGNGDLITNTARIFDTLGKSAASAATTRIGSAANLVLTSDHNPIQPGDLITLTAVFSGVEPLNNGRVQIDLPLNTTFVGAGSGYLPVGDAVFWFLTPQTANFTGQRYLVVQALPALDNGTILSSTAYLSGDGQNSRASRSVTVVSAPNLAASTKTADRDLVEPSAWLMYTVRLANTGNMNAHVATMTDLLPPQVNFAGVLASTGGTPSYDASTRQVTWSGVINVNTPVTVTFAVTVNTGLVSGTLISNYAVVDDEINNPTQLAPATVTAVDAQPLRYRVFLPLVRRDLSEVPQLPDLVVTGISVTPANPSAGQPVDVAVAIKNQGTIAITACFWIDAYINPTRLPITVNQGWFEAGSEGGLVWSACGLGVGESITLHYNDSNYWPSYSQFSGRFLSPRTYALYAQVDSYNLSTTYGAVYESNEQNNVYGPHPVTVSGAAVTGATWTNAAPLKRPDVPPER